MIKQEQFKITLRVTGKLPFKRKLRDSEVAKLINMGKLHWYETNETRCKGVGTSFEFPEGEKVKKISINLWGRSGVFSILGTRTFEEFEDYYKQMMCDFKNCCKEVFQK